MPEQFHTILESLEKLAMYIPLELFVFLNMFIDEIFPPIPSSFLLLVAGAVTKTQGHSLFFLLVYLGLIGAIGKTLGGWILYILGNKAEHFIINKFGTLLRVNHKEIEELSKRLNKGRKDDLMLFLARAIPIVPTTPISVICGILKMNIKSYLIASLLGTWLRSILLLYIGYAGLVTYENYGGDLRSAEVTAQILLIILILGGWVYYKSKRKVEKNKKDQKN